MKKDEIIALLQQQNSFLQEQLQEANRKADALLEEVTSLRNLLEHKSEKAVEISNSLSIWQTASAKSLPMGILQMVSAEFPMVLIRQTLSGEFQHVEKRGKKASFGVSFLQRNHAYTLDLNPLIVA